MLAGQRLLDEGVNDIPAALAVSASGHCYWEGLVFPWQLI